MIDWKVPAASCIADGRVQKTMMVDISEHTQNAVAAMSADASLRFQDLPTDLIDAVAFHVKDLRILRSVIRFDIATVASTKIQRFYRDMRKSTLWGAEMHNPQVGDRILYRPVLPRSRDIYGTADGEIMNGLWKIRLLDGTVMHVQTRYMKRLSAWAYHTAFISAAVTHAASAAREAATLAAQAALEVIHSPTTTAGGETIRLALAAASTASTAATAATAAASALVDAESGGVTMPMEAAPLSSGRRDAHRAMTEAHGMLEVHERLMEAAGRSSTPTAGECSHGYASDHGYVADDEATAADHKLLRNATAAAASASAEAAVATHAASTVCSVQISSDAATTTAAVAQTLMAAVDALASRDATELYSQPLHIAADAIGTIGAAQQRLSTAFAADLSSDALASSGPLPACLQRLCSRVQAQEQALCATQRAAEGVADAAASALDAGSRLPSRTADAACVRLAETAAAREVTCSPGAGIELADIDALLRDGSSTVLWCWLPRSSRWEIGELMERTTRAVAACRASDYVALPDLAPVHELVDHWQATDYGPDRLCAQNIIWFDPEPGSAATGGDPALFSLTRILESFVGKHTGGGSALYCMYPDDQIANLAASYGLRCLGDPDAHPLIGSLRQAKSFLHRSLAKPDRPSLSGASLQAARGPRGFCCETPEQLQEAWDLLMKAHPGIRLVLKPASGTGGTGVVLNATQADVDKLKAQMRSAEERKGRCAAAAPGTAAPGTAGAEETIIEEMVGEPGKPSPTVYMVGSHVTVVADQLLTPCGTVNLGNVSPVTQVGPSVVRAMIRACEELGKHLGLVGQWGVDFVINEHDGVPIMVDLNMGRPNGSLSYYCWRSRQPPPPLVEVSNGTMPRRTLALACSTYSAPPSRRLAPFAASLKAKGLLWDSKRACGIILAQHLPGQPDGGSVVAASWEGVEAAQRILNAFRMHAKTFEAA